MPETNSVKAWAAWHPEKGFDEHHYEGPIAFADMDDEYGVLSIVKDLNELDGTNSVNGWRAVPVEIRRTT